MTKRQDTYRYVLGEEYVERRISYAKYLEAFRAGMAVYERTHQELQGATA